MILVFLSFFSVRATSASASLRYDVNASRLLGDDSVDVLLVALVRIESLSSSTATLDLVVAKTLLLV